MKSWAEVVQGNTSSAEMGQSQQDVLLPSTLSAFTNTSKKHRFLSPPTRTSSTQNYPSGPHNFTENHDNTTSSHEHSPSALPVPSLSTFTSSTPLESLHIHSHEQSLSAKSPKYPPLSSLGSSFTPNPSALPVSLPTHSRINMNPQNIYSPFPTPYPDTIKDATVIDTFFGDDHRQTKLPHHFRFLFNNINGLVLTHTDLINFISITKELQADWVGIVETHIASEKSHVRDCVFSAFQSKQGYNNLNAVFASSDMDFDVDRKFGGVLQIAVNSLASRTITKHSNKYGWFTSQTHTGKKAKC